MKRWKQRWNEVTKVKEVYTTNDEKVKIKFNNGIEFMKKLYSL